MENEQNNIALITARGGSKTLPAKNLRVFGGKPMTVWSIEAALKCPKIRKVYVSTDSPQIREVCLAAGAQVPFLRPTELATDTSHSIEVIMHFLDWAQTNHVPIDTLTLLQPTSPLRTSEDLRGALDLFYETGASSVVSVTASKWPPEMLLRLNPDCDLGHFIPQTMLRQQQETWYQLNGALYVARPETLRKTKSFFGPRTRAYIMPKERSVDIDDAIDFTIAEALLRADV